MKLHSSHIAVALVGAVMALGSIGADARTNHKKNGPVIDSPTGVTDGGSCTSPAPVQITSVPYSDTGTTVGKTDIISTLTAGCSDYATVAGPEAVYSFVAGAGANLTFTVTPDSSTDYDTAIYLVKTCNSGTAAGSCIAGADAYYLPGEAESFSVSGLTNGTTYYLHVDSYYSSTSTYGSGPYSLTVSGNLPVSLQDFSID